MGHFDHLPTLDEMRRTSRAMPKVATPPQKAVKAKAKRTAQQVVKAVRAKAVEQARHRCEACQKWIGDAGEAHHKVKRSQGGKWTAANIKYLCGTCHQKAHGATFKEAK